MHKNDYTNFALQFYSQDMVSENVFLEKEMERGIARENDAGEGPFVFYLKLRSSSFSIFTWFRVCSP